MGTRSIQVDIRPELLVWARESMSYTRTQVAGKLGVDEGRLASWEDGSEKPTLAKLREMAECYKRSLAVFFLPSPPAEKPKLHNFRRKVNARSQMSPDAAREIRKAIRRQGLAVDLARQLGHLSGNTVGRASLTDSVEELAVVERERLGIPVDLPFAWRDEYEALREWKKALESKNVLVFQAERVDVDVFRGLCFYEEQFPVILLNSKDAVVARIFSLLHEYAHLMLRKGDPQAEETSVDKDFDSKDPVEVFCNRFAAAFLIPRFRDQGRRGWFCGRRIRRRGRWRRAGRLLFLSQMKKLLLNYFTLRYEIYQRSGPCPSRNGEKQSTSSRYCLKKEWT